MCEDALIGRTEEGLVAEVACCEKTVMQATAVADVEPLAFCTTALGYVLPKTKSSL